jgi:hypothetical protein
MAFARFMACELKKAKIPYAINADTQFYDGEEGLASGAGTVTDDDYRARMRKARR